jgi:hypothetical protein
MVFLSSETSGIRMKTEEKMPTHKGLEGLSPDTLHSHLPQDIEQQQKHNKMQHYCKTHLNILFPTQIKNS